MYVSNAFNKTLTEPVGFGYDYRPKGLIAQSVLIHTTNNSRITSLEHELRYLRNSPGVSCHDVIPRNGSTVYIIVPAALRAWHAGLCDPLFLNSRSIGIELHNSIGQKPTAQQIALLGDRVRQYIQTFSIRKEAIDTHRQAALPEGRKSDPEGWSDVEFYLWRDSLFMATRVIGTPPSVTLNQFWTWLNRLNAPIDLVVASRIYNLCKDLDIDPAFVAAVWKHETMQVAGKIGSSTLYQKSFNAGALKNYGPGWPSVSHNGAKFNKYESPQLGLMHMVMHLKQKYGAMGWLDVETIIPIYAPPTDKNKPEAYITDVLRSMSDMKLLPE